jgi:hypothetical protein
MTFSVGDSVQVDDPQKNTCIIQIKKNGMVNTCSLFTVFDGGGVTCANEVHTEANEIKKISPIKVPCMSGVPGCNAPNGCSTMSVWPKEFSSLSDCEKWAGTASTWGTCTKFNEPYLTRWVLSCNDDSDCGTERKCLSDSNTLNITHKTCSCKTVDDCQYPDSESECAGGFFGQMECPKTWPLVNNSKDTNDEIDSSRNQLSHSG